MKVLSYGVLKALLVKEREKRERERESKCLGSLAICLATQLTNQLSTFFFAGLGRLLREDVCRHLNNFISKHSEYQNLNRKTNLILIFPLS